MAVLNCNYILYVFLVMISWTSGQGQIRDQHLVMCVKDDVTHECGSGFEISNKLESDAKYKKYLKSYLYRSFIDNERCDSIPQLIFGRPSFTKMLLFIYDDSTFLVNGFNERWKEGYANMLFNCKNDRVTYQLTDSLLKRGIEDGLVSLWNKDIVRLRCLDEYIKWYSHDFTRLSKIVVLYHNSNNKIKSDDLLSKIADLDKERSEKLRRLINKRNKIDYFEFMDEIFGGI